MATRRRMQMRANTLKPRPAVADMIAELRSWLPNYDHGPNDYPTTVFRLLASVPGGEELEDMGFEPLGGISWHELDQLGRMINAIQDKEDVEDLVRGLMSEEEEEEAPTPPPTPRRAPPAARTKRRPAAKRRR